MAIEITEQLRLYRNQSLLTRENVATIADRNNIPVEERFNGLKTFVRSEGIRYELKYEGNFNVLSIAAQNAFLADNNNWTLELSGSILDLKEDKINKGAANGYTPLDEDTRIPEQYLPASLQGAMVYKRGWDASTNTAPSATPSNGWTYKVSVPGTTTFTGSSIVWGEGDFITYSDEISNWERFAKIDAVVKVNDQTGIVDINDSNLEHEPAVSIPDWISSIYTAGVATMKAVFDAIITRIGVHDDQLTDIEGKLETIDEGANNYSPPDYTGDVEILETGETTINEGVVDNDKLASMAANTFKMAIVAGQPIDATLAQVKTALSLPTNTVSDLATKQAAIDSLIQLVASDNFNLDTVQEIVDFIEQNRTDLITYISDLQNKLDTITSSDGSVTIDLTNPNEPDLSVEIPDGLELATEAENIAGTNNTKASSPLGVLQNLAQRAGNGTVWNPTLKKFELGNITKHTTLNGNFKVFNIHSIDQFLLHDTGDTSTSQFVADFGANGVRLFHWNNISIEGSNSGGTLLLGGTVSNLIISGVSISIEPQVAALLLTVADNPKSLVNKEWVEAQIAIVTSGSGNGIFNPVATIAALKAIDTTSTTTYPDKWIINVEDAGLYRLDRESAATGDDNLIIEPTAGVGRWIKLSSQLTSHELLSNLQGGTTGQYYHLTLAQLNKLDNLTKATQTQAEAGTDDAAYMTALKVLQSMAQRAGVGLTYNQTTKKLNIGGSTNGDINLDFGAFNRFRLSGDDMTGGGYRYVNWNYNGLDIDGAGKYKLAINESEFNMYFEGSGAGGSIYANETVMFMVVGTSQWIIESSSGGIKGQIKTTDIETRDDDSVAIKSYVDKTQIGTAITASKTFALTDAGAKKITAVNSASAVVLTIPADATLDFPIGSTINIRRKGAGTVEIVGAVGVTIEGIADSNGDFKIPQYGIASVYKESANLWVIYGALES